MLNLVQHLSTLINYFIYFKFISGANPAFRYIFLLVLDTFVSSLRVFRFIGMYREAKQKTRTDVKRMSL
jgi:hypothetical protein